MTRRTVIFSGQVQGVGFRAATAALARRHQVGGWVSNQADGTVRCVMEGEPAELDRFVKAIEVSMDGLIDAVESADDGPATGEFRDFRIRHCT